MASASAAGAAAAAAAAEGAEDPSASLLVLCRALDVSQAEEKRAREALREERAERVRERSAHERRVEEVTARVAAMEKRHAEALREAQDALRKERESNEMLRRRGAQVHAPARAAAAVAAVGEAAVQTEDEGSGLEEGVGSKRRRVQAGEGDEEQEEEGQKKNMGTLLQTALREAREAREKSARLEREKRAWMRERAEMQKERANETLLHEQCEALGKQVKRLQQREKEWQDAQDGLQRVREEREDWRGLFARIIADEQAAESRSSTQLGAAAAAAAAAAVEKEGDEDAEEALRMAPFRALKALRRYQHEAMALRQRFSDLELRNEQLRSRLQEATDSAARPAGSPFSAASLSPPGTAGAGGSPPGRGSGGGRPIAGPQLMQQMQVRMQQQIQEQQKRIEELQGQLQTSQTRLGDTERQLSAMESAHGRGDLDPSRTKVLRFTKNPSVLQAQKRAKDKLVAENACLRDHIAQLQRQLESGATGSEGSSVPSPAVIDRTSPSRAPAAGQTGGSAVAGTNAAPAATAAPTAAGSSSSSSSSSSGGGGGSSSSDSNSNTTTTTATADSAMVNQRLMEMFRQRIHSYREAVYLLTGYRIDLVTDLDVPHLKLKSMYAENAEDYLRFKWTDDTLELLESPFANGLDPNSFAYLSTCHSVPAFLSTITLDLFERQTFLG